MEYRTCLFLFLVQLCVLTQSVRIESIRSYCGKTITVTSAVRLKLYSYSWPTTRNCQVNFVSSASLFSASKTRMLIRFRSIDLQTGTFGSCTKSRVDITDPIMGTLGDSGGTCGYVVPISQPYVTSGNTMQITLKKMSSFQLSGSFDILVTMFTTDNSLLSNTCSGLGLFVCDNLRCISNSLTNDGYDNCGDDSDEDSYYYSYSLSGGVTAGIVVACIVFFFIIVIAGASAYRRRTYGSVFNTTTVPYANVGRVQNSTTMVSTSQYGFQTPAPAPAAPPPPYPQAGYPTTPRY